MPTTPNSVAEGRERERSAAGCRPRRSRQAWGVRMFRLDHLADWKIAPRSRSIHQSPQKLEQRQTDGPGPRRPARRHREEKVKPCDQPDHGGRTAAPPSNQGARERPRIRHTVASCPRMKPRQRAGRSPSQDGGWCGHDSGGSRIGRMLGPPSWFPVEQQVRRRPPGATPRETRMLTTPAGRPTEARSCSQLAAANLL